MNERLDVTRTLAGRALVVFGGSGFLGKVWLSLVLDRFPGIGRIYLVVRSRAGASSAARFHDAIACSEPLRPVRERRGERWLAEKVVPVDGDVTRPLAGLDEALVASLHGRVDAVVNIAGVVDFSPPLDDAVSVNARGVAHLCDLAHALGHVPVLHTSTCYTAGDRTGAIDERSPREIPFPRCHELAGARWDPLVEVEACGGIVALAHRRADDALQRALFHDAAKSALEARGEPADAEALEAEARRVRRRWIREETVRAGTERARRWGWPNIYTYTKSLGEQILAASGLRCTIARPSIIESSIAFPFPGWNEGINTSAPLVWAGIRGLWQLPTGERTVLDVIPVDHVASGMTLALAELLEGRAAPVYHLASGDTNGVELSRIVDLTALYVRRYWRREHEAALEARLRRLYDASAVSLERFRAFGPPAVGRAAGVLGRTLQSVGIDPLGRRVEKVGETLAQMERVIDVFVPFLVNDYVFSCRETRRAYASLTEADRTLLDWTPERIDWPRYWLEIHCPALERWVFPEIEAKTRGPIRGLRAHPSLSTLLATIVERFGHAPAILDVTAGGEERLTFVELGDLCARRAREIAGGAPPRARHGWAAVVDLFARSAAGHDGSLDEDRLCSDAARALDERLSTGPRVYVGAPLDAPFGLVHGVLEPLSRGAAVVLGDPGERAIATLLASSRATTAVLPAADWLRVARALGDADPTPPPARGVLRALAKNGFPVARALDGAARALGPALVRALSDAPLPRDTRSRLETLGISVRDALVPDLDAPPPLPRAPARPPLEDEPPPAWLVARSGDAFALLDAAFSLEVSGLGDVPPDRPLVAFTVGSAPLDAFVLARALARAPTRAIVLLAEEIALPRALDRAAQALDGIRRAPSAEIGAALVEELDRGRSVGLVLAAGSTPDVLERIRGRACSVVSATIDGSAEAWPAGSAWPRRGRVRVRLGDGRAGVSAGVVVEALHEARARRPPRR